MANGQNIDYSEKKKMAQGLHGPALGLNTIIFKYVYWYMKQILGERLQDHWSSGLLLVFRLKCYLCPFVLADIGSPEPLRSRGELIVYPCSTVVVEPIAMYKS